VSLPTPVKPSSVGAYKLSANGVEVVLPTSITSADEPVGGEVYFEEIDGRDGLFSVRNPVFLGRSLELRGVIFDSVVVDKLRVVLGFKRVVVERDNRILVADVTNVVITERVYGKVWAVNVSFEAPVFFWRSKGLIVQTENPGVVSYEGTLPSFPIFTVLSPTGGITGAHFEVNGRSADFTAASGSPIPAGKHLVIDCENVTAVTEDGSVTGLMNDQFFIDPPKLTPGSNIIEATINGESFIPVEVVWLDSEPIIFNGQILYWYPFVSAFELKYYQRFL
jgi:phage-related protein